MNLYRQPIALFGLVLPLLAAVAVIAVAVMIKSKTQASFDRKMSHFNGFEQKKQDALTLEADLNRKRDFIKSWESLVESETASAVTSNLKEIEAMLPPKEFQKTFQEHPINRSGFATVSTQNSSQVRLAFRATFRSMQRALLELETRMPQLQLQDLRIDPSSNTSGLNVQVNYTAWEK